MRPHKAHPVSLPGDPTFAALPTTIFEVMSVLALRHGAVNLGQGFPDSEGPEDVREVAARAFRDGPNQYPPMLGVPALRQAIADHYRRHQALDVTADQVMVTSGATQALAAAILGLVGPGDEVAMFQPLYDTYAPMVRRAGGVVRPVRLDPPDWRLTPQALDAAIGPSTKLVIFNNPLNPAAVVYDEDQLRALAMACIRHDVIAICDEVWEHIVFDGRRHTPLMGLPGMADRTVKIGSAGKIFSLTGWKVGWTIAPPPLAAQLAKAHQNLQFTVAPGLQLATAYGLGKDMGYFDAMRRDFARSRDRLAAGLKAAGFVTTPSQGTYFLNIDLAASGIDVDDATFCLRAAKEAGVVAIPVSALYEFDPVTTIVRLCFAKRDETLDGGVERLAKARALVLREGVSCGEAGLG